MAPAEKRGNLVSWNQFAIIFGMLVVYFVNYSIALQGDAAWLHTIGWRWMFASEIVPALLFLALLMFVPETPRYLVMRGKMDKALSVLDRLMGKERAAPELVEIKESFRKQEPSMRPYFLFMGMCISGLPGAFIRRADHICRCPFVRFPAVCRDQRRVVLCAGDL